MIPRIETLAAKILVGKQLTMSLANNKTGALWSSFMPWLQEVQHKMGNERYSLQVYDPLYFSHFNPATEFEKWAAVEVSQVDTVPPGMESFLLPGGLYAVFHYKGLSTDTRIYQDIFMAWLPGSPYLIDNRPHFEILGAKYKNNDPASEEEIWIPIWPKQQ